MPDSDPAGHGEVEEAAAEVARDDAQAPHRADREPTPEEERLAEQQEVSPEVSEAYGEAIRRGAAVRGEGGIEG